MKSLTFDNRFVRDLPGDPIDSPHVRQVHGACYSRVMPTPVKAPKLVAHSAEVAALLDLSADDIASQDFADVFGGNALLPGMEPYAACYGGHQFGNWAGQLGDGRAITLGEAINARGERWELQLKGAGPTPYSRRADGRAVLRSSIREFLCSEAMHHLGVPTTRALSLVETGEGVMRDILYDGHPRLEPGAVVCRVSPSFIRFGNFEIFTSRGDEALLTQLIDFTIARDFPHLSGRDADRRAAWYIEVCETTARLMAHWMRVGFVHGVMNTDNMSILGLTIDYGPYGWIDNFDPAWTPNTTDAATSRYRFGNQPRIAHWNLLQLANAVYPAFEGTEPLQEGLNRFVSVFEATDRRMQADKLGLADLDEADRPLLDDLYRLLTDAEVDMTIFYRRLAEVDLAAPSPDTLRDAFYSDDKRDEHAGAFMRWLERYAARVKADGRQDEARRAQMSAANPYYVLRNYMAQEAIDAAERGDYGLVKDLLDLVRNPYEPQPGRERFFARRPDWARTRPGCSMLSCSS